MASSYPGALDNLRADYLGTDQADVVDHAGMHNTERDAINAVQAELGVNPAGPAGTVAERLDRMEDEAIPKSLLTAKGDLFVRSGSDVVRLPADPDGRVLMTDSTTSTGLAYRQVGNLLTANQASGTDTVGTTAGFNSFNATIASSTEQAFRGSRSLKITATGGSGSAFLTAPQASQRAGAIHTFTLWARTSASALKIALGATVGGNIVQQGGGPLTRTITPDTWTQISVSAAIPANINGPTYLYIYPNASGDVVYAGELSFHEGVGGRPTPPGLPVVDLGVLIGAGLPEGRCFAPVGSRYLDESTGQVWAKVTGATATGWQAPVALPSGMQDGQVLGLRGGAPAALSVGNVLHLYVASGGAQGTSGGFSQSAATVTASGGELVATATSTAAFANLQAWAGNVFSPAKPGQVVTALASLRNISGSRTLRLDLQWLDASNSIIATTTGPTTSTSADLAVVGVAPANTAWVRTYVSAVTSGAVGDAYGVTDWSLHRGVGGRFSLPGEAVPDLGTIFGTGSPEGAQIAPVGAAYRDVAATGGVSEWRKVTGAGASGWSPVGASAAASTPRIIAPADISAVVGDTLQVFRRGVIEAADPYVMPSKMDSAVGSEFRRFWEYTAPAGDAGTTKTLVVTAQGLDGSSLATASVNIVVKAAANPASMKRVMIVGDSLTSGGVWAAESYRRLTQTGGSPAGKGFTNFTFIGTDPLPGFPAQKCVGRGGWTWASYTNASPIVGAVITATGHGKDATDQKSQWSDGAGSTWYIEQIIDANTLRMIRLSGTGTLSSGTLTWLSGGTHTGSIMFSGGTATAGTPFWDGTQFSIKAWCDANGGHGPDLLIMQIGWNSINGSATAAGYATLISQAKTFADKLHTEYPAAKMAVIGLQVPSIDGGLGTNYGAAGVYGHYYDLLRSANGLNEAYKAWAAEAGYSSWLRYAALAPVFDTEYNMPATAAPVNTRNTSTERRGTNGVHPDTPGYMQLADLGYREIVRALS